MLSGFYTVASGMLSQQRDLDVIGNNLVNQQTPGYRADRTLISPFEMELATRREASGDAALGRGAPAAVVSEVATLMQNGDLRETGRSFDLAINGDGFFNIRAENGQIMLTRGGNFDTDENGDLVLPGVGRVLGRNGDTLRVGGPGFRVDETGQVYNQDDRRVGSLMLTAPEEGSALTKLDGGLFRAPQGANMRIVNDARLVRHGLDTAIRLADHRWDGPQGRFADRFNLNSEEGKINYESRILRRRFRPFRLSAIHEHHRQQSGQYQYRGLPEGNDGV